MSKLEFEKSLEIKCLRFYDEPMLIFDRPVINSYLSMNTKVYIGHLVLYDRGSGKEECMQLSYKDIKWLAKVMPNLDLEDKYYLKRIELVINTKPCALIVKVLSVTGRRGETYTDSQGNCREVSEDFQHTKSIPIRIEAN